MPVIGTAGHVDHGKSTLVEGLTGRDPDRWDEEKRRGLTIDLGFAWTTLSDGTEVSFVDVPGHERFIKNMLAGTEAIDVALFVVAADEGWMPQSEEHLAVLDLLGVKHGVVAITKTDRVDDDLLELATLEIEERLEGTVFQGAPLIPVAAPNRAGYEALSEHLAGAVKMATNDRNDRGRSRLWIDRAFTISGAGTVVTGTLVDGPIRVTSKLQLWPGGHEVRVRGLQSHEREHEMVGPSTRCAVNLAGLERQEVQRGSMLGLPGEWVPTDVMLVDVQTARYIEDPLTNRGAYHLHMGSGSWPVTLRLVEDSELTRAGAALLRLPEPIPVAVGDRFILRETGRRAVVGGGRVLDPSPRPRRADILPGLAALREALEAGPDRIAGALLSARQTEDLATLAAHSGGGTPAEALIIKGRALALPAVDVLTERATAAARVFQEENPLRPGIQKASLASRVDVDSDFLEALIERTPELRDDGATVATSDFEAGIGADREADWETVRLTLEGSGLTVPRIKELSIDPDLLHALLRDGRLVRVGPELVYLPAQLDLLGDRIREMAAPFTVAEFRDHFGLSRKYAVPLLEWMDANGVTERDGDVRTVQAD
ncbi:MAG: selenocysteine-specific translation elongation factor [Acidimicrobiia bacterium]|nr:selenocysteine-specific translation elongation factor [Acidimicrobiia bacterium]